MGKPNTLPAVVQPEPKGLITEDMAKLFAEDAGLGAEDMGREDYAIPFLKILQGLSPELQRGEPKYIPGAEIGDLVNSVTGELIKGDVGIQVVRVYFEKKYLEWRPRKAGGGLVNITDALDQARALKQPDVGNPDVDTEIIETAQIYCLAIEPAGPTPVVLAWSKTKLKAARQWAALTAAQIVNGKQVPIPGVVYRLTTKSEKNAKGTFAVPSIAFEGYTTQDLYLAAKKFREAIQGGKVQVKHEDVADDIPAGESYAPDGPDDAQQRGY